MPNAYIREALPGDAMGIGKLLRSSFPEAMHPYLPFCQADAWRHVRSRAIFAHLYPETRQWVAVDDTGDCVGFARFAGCSGNTHHLAYICVDARMRGQRVAPRLIREHLRRNPAATTLTLDVFSRNERARQLYDHLGMVVSAEVKWWSRQIAQLEDVRGVDARALVLRNPDCVVASYEAFGFAEAEFVDRFGELHNARLPSQTVLRPTNVDAWTDPQLQASARSILPALREVVISTDGHAPAPQGGHCVTEALTMRGATSEVLERLR